MIKYSILIITYNQKEIIEKTLKALAAQVKNPKLYEIVVADDCSTDGTEEVVKRQRLPIFLKYIKSDKNVGRSIIRNMGFQKTVGEQVIFLDGDMEPAEGMMDAYFRSWSDHPGAVIVGSWKQPEGMKKNRALSYILSRGRFRNSSECLIPGNYFNSGNFSIPREVFERLSGFDLAFEGWKGEDTDFGLRLEKESIPIRYNPDALSYHHHPKTLKEMEYDYDRFGRTSYKILAEKHGASEIFKNGWIIGLPDIGAGAMKKTLGFLLVPFRSRVFVFILGLIAKIQDGRFCFNLCYSWYLYCCMLRGYRKSG